MSKSVLHSIKLLTSIGPLILEYLVDMGCETNFVMYYFLFISFKIYSLLLSFFSIFLSFYSRIFRNTSLFTLFLKLRLKCIQSMRLRVKRQAGLQYHWYFYCISRLKLLVFTINWEILNLQSVNFNKLILYYLQEHLFKFRENCHFMVIAENEL